MNPLESVASFPMVLYHYCATSTFHSIVESKSVRLSALSLSNDTMEGKLVARTFARLTERDSMDQTTSQRLLEMLGWFDEIFDGLGFCLSEERDLLSQWRGYAVDGTGVSIGFSRAYFEELSKESVSASAPGFGVHQVEYDPSKHEMQVEPTYLEAQRLIQQGAFSFSGLRGLLDARSAAEVEGDRQKNEKLLSTLSVVLLQLLPKLYLMKSPAFREEREWRLLSHLVHGAEDDSSYRVKDDRIIPFRTVPLTNLDRKPIVEVVLGPKHSTPPRMVKQFLARSGYGDVVVSRSDATYR